MPASSSPNCSRAPASTVWQRDKITTNSIGCAFLNREIRHREAQPTKQMKQSTTSPGKTDPLNLSSPNRTPTPQGSEKMTRPSFRFFIIPLGAICTLATLSAQNAAPRAQRDTGSMLVRQQVVDCSNKNPSEVCVISYDSETSAR